MSMCLAMYPSKNPKNIMGVMDGEHHLEKKENEWPYISQSSSSYVCHTVRIGKRVI